MSSKVYFSDLRVKTGDSLLKKMDRLITKAGIDNIDFTDKFVAIKTHFGEYGNLSMLRQQYAKTLCDHIKARGGKPFLTDANTLYVGYRNNALKHLDAAYMNGFNPLSTGVHTIIADGLRGTDERLVPVVNGEFFKHARIASAIAEADIVISLTHFKGHVSAGFGGALKNLGMGSGSKMGKMEMHSSGTAGVNTKKCIGCGSCERHCANNGVHIIDKKAVIDEEHCVGCGYCLAYCPTGAISTKWDAATTVLAQKIAEYAKAVVDGKPSFHISFVTDVSPECDCEGGNDVPVIPDVGIFASFDPVAIDQACADAANKMPVNEESAGNKKHSHSEDLFKCIHPDTNWEAGLEHAQKIGLGSRNYELVTV